VLNTNTEDGGTLVIDQSLMDNKGLSVQIPYGMCCVYKNVHEDRVHEEAHDLATLLLTAIMGALGSNRRDHNTG